MKSLWQQSLSLWHERRARPAWDFARRSRQIVGKVAHYLRERRLGDRDNQRLLDEWGRHDDAGSLLRFLSAPSLEPTNNRAERAWRPAVIARKVSHCTKNAGGTSAFECCTSVLRTLSRNLTGPALLDAVVHLLLPAAPQPA